MQPCLNALSAVCERSLCSIASDLQHLLTFVNLLTLTLRTNNWKGVLCRKYREKKNVAILVYAPFIFLSEKCEKLFFSSNP